MLETANNIKYKNMAETNMDNQNQENNPSAEGRSYQPGDNTSKATLITVVVVIVVVAIVAGVWAILGGKLNKVTQPAPGQQPAAPQAKIEALPATQIPSGLPADIPWETNVKLISNFQVTDPATNKTQSTRIYLSAKTVAQNLALYQKYFQDNGWTLFNNPKQGDINFLGGTKGNASLTVAISKDQKNQVTVNVTNFQ